MNWYNWYFAFMVRPVVLSLGQTKSSVTWAFLFNPSPTGGLLSSLGYTSISLRRKWTVQTHQINIFNKCLLFNGSLVKDEDKDHQVSQLLTTSWFEWLNCRMHISNHVTHQEKQILKISPIATVRNHMKRSWNAPWHRLYHSEKLLFFPTFCLSYYVTPCPVLGRFTGSAKWQIKCLIKQCV